MMDPGLDLHRLGDERLNDVHRNPRRAEARGDLARLEIDGLDRFESGGDSKESRIGFGLLTRKGEPGSHRPRERLVGGHPVVEMRRGANGIEIDVAGKIRSEEHTSELQSLMRIPYAVFCLQKK